LQLKIPLQLLSLTVVFQQITPLLTTSAAANPMNTCTLPTQETVILAILLARPALLQGPQHVLLVTQDVISSALHVLFAMIIVPLAQGPLQLAPPVTLGCI